MAKVLQFVKDYLSQRKEKMDVISYLEEQLELKDLQKMTKIELDENSLTAFIDVGKIDDYLSRNFIKVKFKRRKNAKAPLKTISIQRIMK